MLSKSEFAKMYSMMKVKVAEEQKMVADEHAKLNKSQRRGRLLCAAVAMAVPVMFILLLGNMGLVYAMIRATKDTHILSIQGSAKLEDNSGHVVETASFAARTHVISASSRP